MPKHVRTLKNNRRNRILPILSALRENPNQTAKQLEISPVEAGKLVNEGLIKVSGKVRTEQRGRPAHIYRNTDAGNKRVKRAQG